MTQSKVHRLLTGTSGRRVCSRLAGFVAVSLVAASLFPTFAVAQGRGEFDTNPRGSRDRFDDDDLLRSLIESEMDRRNMRATDPRSTLPPSRVIDSPTRELIQLRRSLDDLSRDADDLASMLGEEARRNSEVRTFLTDVLRLRARVSILAQRAQSQNDHTILMDDLRLLDRDWRLLAVRLAQVRTLGRQTLAQIDRINQQAKALGEDLKIAPQLNYRELSRLTASMSSDISNLLEDVQIELARTQQSTQLISSGRRLRQQANVLANSAADQRQYDIILEDYKQFERLWTTFANDLRPFQNRYLDRHVRRIAESDNAIHDLLWLPRQIDRQRLLYLTDALKRDVDEFFSRTPLKLLIDLPDTRLVLPTSHEFYGVCSNFTDDVNNNASMEDLLASFQYIEDAHRSFIDVFRNVNSQAALQVLRQIDQGVRDLREAMNLQNNNPNHRAAELAALIDNLAAQLEVDTKRWLDRYRAPFRSQALQEVAAFSTQARRLNESITQGNNPTQQQRDVSLMWESWRRVYGYISKCDTDDRMRLQSLSTQITPALVDLQTLIAP